MATTNGAVSPELARWLSDSRARVIDGQPLLVRLTSDQERAQAMKEVVADPSLLLEVWSHIADGVRAGNGKPGLPAEASRISQNLAAALSKSRLSHGERHQLVGLVEELDAADTSEGMRSIVEGAERGGRISPGLARRLNAGLSNGTGPAGAGQSERWNWGACGFCAVLGFVEGGPIGAGVGCVVCGLLAP